MNLTVVIFQVFNELVDNIVDLKLSCLIWCINFYLFNCNSISYFFDFFNPLCFSGFFFYDFKIIYLFTRNVVFFFSIKFLIAIAFLILIRGGTPRYRYDYLTKLGWLKFITFSLAFFLWFLILFLIY